MVVSTVVISVGITVVDITKVFVWFAVLVMSVDSVVKTVSVKGAVVVLDIVIADVGIVIGAVCVVEVTIKVVCESVASVGKYLIEVNEPIDSSVVIV